MEKKIMVKISSIVIDEKNHPREHIDSKLVSQYAEDMQRGAKFPPITLFHDGSKYYLADGRHRYEAAKRISMEEILAEVIKGTKKDAILFAVGANATHGIQRTNADKRKAVKILLTDHEWRKWSLRTIAEKCNVSDWLVAAVYEDCREELHLQVLADASERLYKRDGKVIKQKTGKRKKKKKLGESSPAGSLGKMISLSNNARNFFETENKPQLVAQVDRISNELQEMLGAATHADYRMEDTLGQPINVYERPRKDGVKKNKEFAKKGLCNYSVGVGLTCGHQCTYCSTPALLRTHEAYVDIGITSFNRGFAVVDPNSPQRISEHMPKKLTKDDVIQLSTIDDAWSPESRKYDLGRKVMEVLLNKTDAQIRVLTKCADVAKDFPLFKKFGDRVIVGLSTGIPPHREDVAKVIEPNASTIKKRLEALRKAHDMGLRTYGMLCPCLPFIADRPLALNVLFDEVLACGAEDIWLEPVNARGKALTNTIDALKRAGLKDEANAVEHITTGSYWSTYARELVERSVEIAKERKALDKLHILLYTSSLEPNDLEALKKHKKGIVWLVKKKKTATK